jgi:hypothetical protein
LLAERPEVDVRHIRGDGNIISARTILASVEDTPGEQMPLL